MTVHTAFSPLPTPRGRVIALHCSGAGTAQWCTLAEVLGGDYEVAAPEHYGTESTGAWSGAHAFTLADEAARTLALIDRCNDKVHLVGHSYGGGVALKVALARPDRIASLALYEPSAFYLLWQLGEAGADAHAEITSVARRICEGVVTGDYRGCAEVFVDYWNGRGAWAALRPHVQASVTRWMPKGPLDFRALLDEPTLAEAYCKLPVPVLLLRGERAPGPTRVIAEGLAGLLPSNRLTVVDGAGHMGPLTHAQEVAQLIGGHIRAASEAAAARQGPTWHPRRLADLLGVTSH